MGDRTASGSTRRGLRRGLLLAGVLLFAALAFTGWQAWHVRGALLTVADELSALGDSVGAGDVETADRQLAVAADAAATARTHTRGPLWWVGSHLPVVGDDVTAVRTVAAVADDLTRTALPDLVDAGSQLSSEALAPEDGRINLKPIAASRPALARGTAALEATAATIDDLDTSGLLPQLRGPVADLEEKLHTARDLARSATTAADLLPPMLGGDGKRTYLLVFQNNAEVRAGGGLPGAFAVLTADAGRIKMTRQSAPADIGYLDSPADTLSPAEQQLFTDRIVRYSQDTVINPHFPRAADLLGKMWQQTQGQRLDGVVSIDPVALSYVLKATGPVQTPDGGELTSGNAVDRLLRDTYLNILDGEAQNEYFAVVARSVFDKVVAGGFDAPTLVRALHEGVGEHRILAWSTRAAEQKVLAPLTISGSVPDTTSVRPEIGLYLNDSGSDKLTYYLDHRVDVTPRLCGTYGNQRIDVTATFTSAVPGGPLNEYVAGPGTPGVPLGDMLLTTYLYAPVGGRIDEVRLDGTEIGVLEATHRGREVAAHTMVLPRGKTHVLEYRVYSGRGQTGTPHVISTPGVRSDGIGTVGESAC